MKQFVAWTACLVVLLVSSPVFAAQWPVWPFNTNAGQHRVVQDYGCVGKPSKIIDGTIQIPVGNETFDSCVFLDKAHIGIDIGCETANCPYPGEGLSANEKELVKPVVAGQVLCINNTCTDDGTDTSCNHGYGNSTAIKCGFNCVDIYGHMEPGSVRVVKGSYAYGNTTLGVVGKSGKVTGKHLHYERRREDPNNAAICKSDPMPTAGYVVEHPANYNILDPWTVLTTPDYRLLTIPAGTRTSIRRGPGKKYSAFAKTYDNQTYVAFAHVDVTEEDYDLSMTVMRTWYRIDLPCSEESSCAGWIAEDGIADHDLIDTIGSYTGGPACFPIVFMNKEGSGVNVRVAADATSTNLYNAKTGAYQIYGTAGFPVKGDGTTCSCWFPIHRPEFVYTKNQPNAWICGGTPFVFPTPCPTSKVGHAINIVHAVSQQWEHPYSIDSHYDKEASKASLYFPPPPC